MRKNIAGIVVAGAALLGSAGASGASPPNDFLSQNLVAQATVTPQPSKRETAELDAYTAAPVPDVDHDAPNVADPQAARLSPKLFHNQRQYHGEGYVFGSTVQDQQDRRAGPTPGINLIMPLQ